MKWLGYLLSIIVSISLIFLIAFMEGPLIYLVPLYGGLLIYLTFRSSWEDRIPAVKKITVIGIILTIILIIESLILRELTKVVPFSLDYTPIFERPSIVFVIGLGVIFVAIPSLLAFLEDKPDEEGLVRNPLLVFVYVILTLGIYQIYWFWLIKKGLIISNIHTISLWWFLLPVVGMILIYIDFSKALEQRTRREFITWFLVFLLFQGLDVVINQAIINHDLLKQRA